MYLPRHIKPSGGSKHIGTFPTFARGMNIGTLMLTLFSVAPTAGEIEGHVHYPGCVAPPDIKVWAQSKQGIQRLLPSRETAATGSCSPQDTRAFYTEAVRCGLQVSCIDSTVLIVEVLVRHVQTRIDSADWVGEAPALELIPELSQFTETCLLDFGTFGPGNPHAPQNDQIGESQSLQRKSCATQRMTCALIEAPSFVPRARRWCDLCVGKKHAQKIHSGLLRNSALLHPQMLEARAVEMSVSDAS